MFRKLFSVQSLLWLALLLALVGSLRHVAWGFSTLENGDIVAGYVQAIAVDLGLFALAIGIQQRRRQRRGAFVLWVGVVMFALLSTYANLLHGVQFKSDIDLGKWTSNKMIMSWLDFLRPVLMSAVLPLLVVYLSEIAGSDIGFALDAATREQRRLERQRQKDDSTEKNGAFPMSIDEAREHRKANADMAEDDLWRFVVSNPDMAGLNYEQVGKLYGRSRQWVSGKFRTWERAGAIERGNGRVNVLVVERPGQG